MTASYLPVLGLKPSGGSGGGELGVAQGATAFVNLETELNKLSVDIQNGAVVPVGSVTAGAAFESSGVQKEVSINAEHEPSATSNTIVSLVGSIETKKAPIVKIEVGPTGSLVLASETSAENPAAGTQLVDINTIVVAKGAVYKVPTVSGLAKLFVSYAFQG